MAARYLRGLSALTFVVLLAGVAPAAGLLVPRNGLARIQVASHRVVADVDDGMARTTIRQTFVNPHPRMLEAIYVFPLPEGAALAHVAMETGGKRYEGLLVERKHARRTYDQIVRRRQDPALVEQIGRNTFRLSVYPVLPGQPTVVEITYTQSIPLAHGSYRYVYPLAMSGEATTVEQDLTVLVRLHSSAPLAEVTSPTPGMAIVRKDEHASVASLEITKAQLDQDIVVEAKVAVANPTIFVSTFKEEGRPGTFMAVITPPSVTEDRLVPRDVILCLDTSGSMKGTKIEQAKRSAEYLIRNLRTTDRIGILLFNTSIEAYADRLVLVTEERKAALLNYVRGVRAQGSTALGDALKQAAVLGSTAEKGRARTVVLLTDGLATVGETDPTRIVGFAKAGAKKGLRLFPFGVGEDVDAGLLRGIARAGHGTAEIFRPGGEIAGRLKRFLDRTASPVLGNLRITVDGVKAFDVYPRPLPDVYLGEQIVVTGRYRGGGPVRVTARADFGGTVAVLAVGTEFRSAPGGAITARDTYARQKLTFLEETLRIRKGLSDDAYFAALDRGRYGTSDEIVREIVEVSLESGIQCGYTSFLVLLPEDRARLDPRNFAAVKTARERMRSARREGLPAREDGDPVVRDDSIEDHNEMDVEDEFEESKSDDDLCTDAPFDGPSTGAAIGIGGGAGGSFRGRGGRRILRAEGGGGTQGAVDLGLEWLKWHQDPDGFWDADGFEKGCKLNRCGGVGEAHRDPGVTGLALLSFLGAGETHKTGRYRRSVKVGLKYLKQIQDPEGCFGPRTNEDFLLSHAWAALAMSEAYALTGSPLFKQSAQSAVDFIVKARNPHLGWGKGVRSGDNDIEITCWMMMVLKSAKAAGGLLVPAEALAEARDWLDTVTGDTGLVGSAPGAEFFLTPAAILARIFADEKPRESKTIRKGIERCTVRLPVWDEKAGAIDMRHWYFGSLAMFQNGGEPWKAWNLAMKAALIDHQRKDGDQRGSWDPVGAWGKKGGRVYATAMMTMCLEVYYRYTRVFGTR